MEAKTNKSNNRTGRTNNRGALLLTHDGKIIEVPYNGDFYELRRLIKCALVEPVYLQGPLSGLVCWCDEEGKLKPHGVNFLASALCRYGAGVDYMAGRCVILDDDGESCKALSGERRALARWAVGRAAGYAMASGEKIKATGPSCKIVEIVA